MPRHELCDLFRFLVGHESARNLGPRPGRHNGLGSTSLIPAKNAIDLEGRPGPAPFERRVSLFARERRNPEEMGVRALVKWQTAELFPLPFFQRTHRSEERR